MNDRIAARSGARSAPAVLTSVPWLVVLVGAGVLATLLVFALLSFRGPEHRAAPPPAPPLYLPTMPPTPSVSPSSGVDDRVAPTEASRSPEASPSPSAEPSSPSASPSAAGTPSPAGAAESAVVLGSTGGKVTAGYQVAASDRDSFDARLQLSNGTTQAQQWRVELVFGGNVKSAQMVSSGASVGYGGGVYTVRGSGELAAGRSTTVTVRFFRNGTGDLPGQCTVNGSACNVG